MSDFKDEKIILPDMESSISILGLHGRNLRFIEKKLNVKIVARGESLYISGENGDDIQKAKKLFGKMIALLVEKDSLDIPDIGSILNLLDENNREKIEQVISEIIQVTARGKRIQARTLGQYKYVQAIKNRDIVFGIGPAGTGKTYLAVVMAIKAYKSKIVQRIILTRPAVEAGEKLGFLPGDLQDKVDPYLRPLYDGLYDVLGIETARKYMEKGVIEIAPLAYMRGRTLDDSFVILDEAQNTTPEQMKMFLTRIGFGSKAVITGDITQVDLPKGNRSGLIQVEKILKDIPEIAFEYLNREDIVRHPVVSRIIAAYEDFEKE